MSTTIDQRVVEMRFENDHFEKNVQTSMGTLEKLKQKLHLTGAAKGFDNLNKAANNVNMSGLGNAVETVRTKFSALEVMGVTALANITNSAVNAGKRIVSALTIDPVTTGFNEYETKINSIQTIMSNTASKGTTMEDVTRVIDELNTYADKTIYNFAEMTRNIGTFTAAGVGLEESAAAIQGIANLAAASGSNSQQASTAMYQLSQALAAGTVKLMDWNSVVNAGMGGEKFQEALKATAREMGTDVDALIEKNGSFRDSLHSGWITADVLNTTLKKFTKEGAKEYADAMVKSGKYTQEQADALLKEAQNMEDAATKVKTFTQLWDTLKESAQSGWGKTWELIFGDFEEAKELFSGLSDFLGGFINKMSDARNNLLEGALGSPFEKLSEKISKVTGATEAMTKVTKDYSGIVDKIIDGEFGDGQARWDKLAEMGYDWAHAQNLVNEKLGNGVRHATNYKEAQNGANEVQAKSIEQLVKMSDAQLKNLKFTDSEIKALRDLEEQSKKTGIPLDELVKDMDQLSGRTLLINSFKNAGQGLVAIFKAMKDAWTEIFPPMTSEQLYDAIAGFHKFSTHLVVSEETADKLKRTLKGVFAIIDIITTVVGGGLKFAIKVVSKLLGMADIDILDLTANLGDLIVRFRDWIDQNNFVMKGLEKLSPYLKKAGEAFKDWIEKLKDSDNIPRDIIKGLVNGLIAGVGLVIEAGVKMAKSLWQAVKDFLGIHSPSTKFIEIGKNIVLGLIEGIKSIVTLLYDLVTGIGSKLIEIVKDIDLGTILSSGIIAALLLTISKVTNVMSQFAIPFQGLGSMFEGIGDFFEGLGKSFKASAWEKKSKAIRNVAISIGILAASVYLLAQLKPGQLWATIGAIAALGTIVVGLAIAFEKLSKLEGFSLKGLSMSSIGIALLLIAFAVKTLAKIPENDARRALGMTIILAGVLAGIVFVFGKFVEGNAAQHSAKVGKMLVKMSVALLLMVGVIKLISYLTPGEIAKGLITIGLIGAFFAGLLWVSRTIVNKDGSASGNPFAKDIGKMLVKMAIATLLMVGVIKLISGLAPGEITKGIITIGLIGALFAALTWVSKFAGQNVSKAGSMFMKMSMAILVMTFSIKMLADMKTSDIKKGLTVIAAIGLIFTALTAVSHLAGKNAVKAGGMMLMMSGAILVLSGAMFVLSKIKPDGLKRSLIAVSIISLLFMGLIAVTKLAKNCEKEIFKLSISIAIIAGVVAVLSFIKPDKLRNATLAVMGITATFALLIGVMKYAKKVKLSQMLIMVGVVGLLGGILATMAYFDAGGSIKAAGAISALLLAMTGAMLILSKMHSVSLKGIGALALMGLIVGELALMFWVMKKLDVDPSLETVTALGIMLTSMAGVLKILSMIGPAASMPYPAMLALAALIGGAAVVIGLLGGIACIPGVKKALTTGVWVMEQIGLAVGKLIGGVIGGIGSAISGQLPGVAENLSEFMDKIGPFVEGAAKLDESALDKVGILVDVIMAISGATIIDSIASFIAGESSIKRFTKQIIPFGKAIAEFSEEVSGIDKSAVTAAANAGKMLSAINSETSITSIINDIFGNENDLKEFGKQIVTFGKCMCDFSDEVAGNIDPDAVEAAANAGKMMADLSKYLCADGLGTALVNWITDQDNLQVFGEELLVFGKCIVEFSDVISQGGINPTAIQAAKWAGEMMADLAKYLCGDNSNTTALVNWFTDQDNLAEFGKELLVYGGCIVEFSKTISSGGINPTAVQAAKWAGEMMADLAKYLCADSNADAFVNWITQQDNLAIFGSELAMFGVGVAEFSKTISGKIDQSAVSAATMAGSMLGDLSKSLCADSNGEAFVNWITQQDNLAYFGSELPVFGAGIASFCDAIKDISVDQSKISAVVMAGKGLAEISKALCADSGWEALVTWITDQDNLKDFGIEVGCFGAGIAAFGNAVSGATFNASAISAAVMAGKGLAEVAKAICADDTWDAFINWITDQDNLATFGSQLPEFAKGIVGFMNEVSKTDMSNFDAIDQAVKATDAIAKLGNALHKDKDGGLSLLGDLKLEKLSSQLTGFGTALVDFSDSLEGLDVTSMEVGVTAATAIADLVGALKGVANEGGISEWWGGKLELSNFGSNLKDFGTCLVAYANSVAGINTSGLEMSIAAADAVAKIVEVTPTSGGIESFIAGTTNVATFGSQLVDFGKYLKLYSFEVMGTNVASIAASSLAAASLSQVIKNIPKLGGVSGWFNGEQNMATFGSQLVDFGKSLKNYSEVVSGVNPSNMSAVNAQVKQLVDVANMLSDIDGDVLSDFSNSLGKVGKAGIDSFIKAFDDAKPRIGNSVKRIITIATQTIKQSQSNFKNEGSTVIKRFVDGVNTTKNMITSSFLTVITASLSAIRGSYTGFYNAGAYIVSGLANGISDNTYKAKAKAQAMATAAKEAAEDALGINSPSRVFYAIGEFTGQGFVNALHDYGTKSYNAGSEIADSARSGLSNAIGRITDLINSDMETQPTIRPVLDLSNVQSGVGSLNNMLNLNPSVGVMANVGAINSMMNQRNQNGVNGDVVSAIDKLRGDLSNMGGGDTYTINGVTYDDGSNISDAVKSIVRAARIERRT